MHPITYVAAVILLAGFVAYSLYDARERQKRNGITGPPLPGPRLVPFIGRIHDLPIQYMWLKFKEWADVYGPIYYTEMLGAKFVIISDEKIAEELLVKRAKFNSDRPRMMSVTDSKSTDGGMEYLPLMGRNREFLNDYPCGRLLLTLSTRILGPSTSLCTLVPYRSQQCPLPRYLGF